MAAPSKTTLGLSCLDTEKGKYQQLSRQVTGLFKGTSQPSPLSSSKISQIIRFNSAFFNAFLRKATVRLTELLVVYQQFQALEEREFNNVRQQLLTLKATNLEANTSFFEGWMTSSSCSKLRKASFKLEISSLSCSYSQGDQF